MNTWMIVFGVVLSAAGAAIATFGPKVWRLTRCTAVHLLSATDGVRCVLRNGHPYLRHHWHSKTHNGSSTIEWEDDQVQPHEVQIHDDLAAA
jgi:hypothetical protein